MAGFSTGIRHSPPLCWWARTEEYIDRLGFARRHLIHKSRLGGFNFLANCVGTIANTTCNSACKPLATTYKEQPAGGRKSSRTSRLAQETHIYAQLAHIKHGGRRNCNQVSLSCVPAATSASSLQSAYVVEPARVSTPMGELETVSYSLEPLFLISTIPWILFVLKPHKRGRISILAAWSGSADL